MIASILPFPRIQGALQANFHNRYCCTSDYYIFGLNFLIFDKIKITLSVMNLGTCESPQVIENLTVVSAVSSKLSLKSLDLFGRLGITD